MLQAELELPLGTITDYDRAAELFHEDHPFVYREFERRVREALAEMGPRRRPIGAKRLWENMRWDFEFKLRVKSKYRLNNNHIRFYSQRFERLHPHLGRVFTHRKAKD